MRYFSILLFTLTAICSFGNTQADPIFKINADKTTFCSSDSARIDATGCSGNIKWNSGEVSPWIITHQSGFHFATCLSNGAISDTIITNVTSPTKPNIAYTLINNDKTLVATSCNGDVIWSNGMLGTSIIVTQNGTYNAYCSLMGCLSEDSNTIHVTNVPKPTVTASKTQICTAESTTLTATGCGSTADYFWNNGSTGSAISVDIIGDYWAYCVVNNETGPISDTLHIKSLEPPKLIVSSNNGLIICSGNAVTLVASDCPQGTIVWNTGSSGSSVSITQAGTYTARCQNICGLGAFSDVVIVHTGNSPSAPVITADKTNLCSTEKAILTATGCNGTPLWSDGRTGIIIEVTASGTYSAICQNECRDSPKSNEVVIQKYNLPSAPFISSSKSIICPNETAVLTSSGCAGIVNWNNGATATQITVGEGGTYSAICKNTCGESGISNSIDLRKFDNPAVPIITGSSTICVGGSTVLNIGNCIGGNSIWSNGSSGNTLTISQVGSYSAKCVNICGESGFSIPFNIIIGIPQCVPITILIHR